MIYIILACLLYTTAILLGTAASRNADTNLVSFLTSLLSVVAPLAVIVPNVSKKMVFGHKFGLTMAVLGGLVIGIFVMALNKSFSVNKVGIVAPVVFGGAILLSTVASYFIFKEKVSVTEGIGLVIVLVGLVVVIYARTTVGQ